MANVGDLVKKIAQIGQQHPSPPPIHHVDVFDDYFLPSGEIDYVHLDDLDGLCTRREALLRFLLLNAVVDQGPDIVGVRRLLVDVINDLYKRGVRFLHQPAEFFDWLGVAADLVREWQEHPFHSLDFLESFDSAEAMNQALKGDTEYGLGKAIGDKACHLFAKWMVSTFRLTRRAEQPWGPFSFEVPYDSNAGRVLWRTGYLSQFAWEEEYGATAVIQAGKGKGGKKYIRVTNIRGMPTFTHLSSPPANLPTRSRPSIWRCGDGWSI